MFIILTEKINFFRALTIIVLFMLIRTLCFGIAVYINFQSFLSPTLKLIYVCIAWSLSTGSQFATITLYNMCCYFLIQRVRCINSILNQLIFDNPLSAQFLLLNSNHQIVSQDFSYNQQQHYQSAKCDPGNKNKWIKLKWLWKVQGKTAVMMMKPKINRITSIDESMKKTLNKIWTVKVVVEKDDQLHHLDNLVNRFNLTDIKTLLQMWVKNLSNIYIRFFFFFLFIRGRDANKCSIQHNIHEITYTKHIQLTIRLISMLFNVLFMCRSLISDVTFTRESNVDYIIRKLNRMFVIVNNMMDCFELLNVCYTKYIFGLMLFFCLPAILYGFGRFRWVLTVTLSIRVFIWFSENENDLKNQPSF